MQPIILALQGLDREKFFGTANPYLVTQPLSKSDAEAAEQYKDT